MFAHYIHVSAIGLFFLPSHQRFLHRIASNLEYFSVSAESLAVVRLNLISIIIGRWSNWHRCMIDQSLSQIAASPSVPFLHMKHGPTKPKSWTLYNSRSKFHVSFPLPTSSRREPIFNLCRPFLYDAKNRSRL